MSQKINKNGGFIQIIILIVFLLLFLAYKGFDVKAILDSIFSWGPIEWSINQIKSWFQ
jgi:hypothetical protein